MRVTVKKGGNSASVRIPAVIMEAAHSALDEIVDIREPETPRSDDEFERGFGAMLARRARAATGLAQQNFAEQFGIPADSFRDWE